MHRLSFSTRFIRSRIIRASMNKMKHSHSSKASGSSSPYRHASDCAITHDISPQSAFQMTVGATASLVSLGLSFVNPRPFSSMAIFSLVALILPSAAAANATTTLSTPPSPTLPSNLLALSAHPLGTLLFTLLSTLLFLSLLAWLDARYKAAKPLVHMAPNATNEEILGSIPSLSLPYSPRPFLTNNHIETILASLLRVKPAIEYDRELLTMASSDGGTVTLDCCSYVLHAVLNARKAGMRPVVFNSRGTADSPVTSPQFYSASFTGDTREVVAHVASKWPKAVLLAAGWSLGANILCRYLGEEGEGVRIKAAVSMCNPFDLTVSNTNFAKGLNKIYDKNLAKALRAIFAKHDKTFRNIPLGSKMRPDLVPEALTVRQFDEAITIHSFGWTSVDAYYAGSSSSLSIPKIKVPLLCIQALDDPIAPKEAIPYDSLISNENCLLVTTPTGGHLGWTAGMNGPFDEPWTDQVTIEWFKAVLSVGGMVHLPKVQLPTGDQEPNRSKRV